MKHIALVNNEKGQTFVVVMMLMILALTIGITISSRFIKSIRTIVASDNSSRALSVAEAAVERVLLIPSETLETYIDGNSCGSDCFLEILDITGQKLTANVTLSYVGNSNQSYAVTLIEDEISQVTIAGYQSDRSVNVCWNGEASVVGYYLYSQAGVIKATPLAYNAVLTLHNDNGFSSSAASLGYANCFSIVASQTPLALRLRSMYARADAQVIPEAGYTIPVQGIKIVSVGKAGDAVRKVTVIKSTAFAPSFFDYAVYQKSWTDSLSN